MVLTVTAIEDMRIGTQVSLQFNDNDQIYARHSTSWESPDAIAARDIQKGETIVFDTGRNTSDLLRPRSSVS